MPGIEKIEELIKTIESLPDPAARASALGLVQALMDFHGEALDRLMKDKTSIVIAHHLATIARANMIFVVKDHHLTERGTHDELLAAGGFYAELHGIQLGT